ncbi:MAG: glutaredoxin 3 [Desulfobulbia bacterium]
MTKITIYTAMFCPFCGRAKNLLKMKGVNFEEIDVTFSPTKRWKMTELANGRTSVPQIFINQRAIGGCDDLFELDKLGELDAILAG